MSELPWYAAGLGFHCTGCGDCCTGEPGAVWVNREEVAALAAAVGLDLGDFEARYLRSEQGRQSLVEEENGDCVLFDPVARRCRVYEARPTQCRTWPFWEANLTSPRAWEEARRQCPGIGEGERVSAERIRRQLVELSVARRKR